MMFVDVSDDVGLKEISSSIGAGRGMRQRRMLDLYVSNHLPIVPPSHLYHNNAGVFAPPKVMASGDCMASRGRRRQRRRGRLFVGGGDNTPTGPAFANFLFHKNGGVLENVAASAGVEDMFGRAHGGAWADYDRDGHGFVRS